MKGNVGRRYNKYHDRPESDYEDYLVDQVEKLNGRAVKGKARNQRGEADRFCFFPGALVVIVEVKRPGQKPRRNQELKLQWFRKRGFQATYIDTFEKVDAFIEWVKNYQKKYKVRHVDQLCYRQDCPMRRNTNKG